MKGKLPRMRKIPTSPFHSAFSSGGEAKKIMGEKEGEGWVESF